MAVKRKYRLNLRNYGNLPAIMLSQYDEGYALEFEIRDGTDAASDLSAYTVTLKGTRADTLAYSFAGTVSTNVLTFVIDTTMTACAGRGTAEIAIKDTANDVLFATFNMPVFVERAAVPEGSIDADVERAQEIAEQVQEIVDNAAAAVSGAAEKWATGQIDGTDVPSTDPAYENNAKYYAEQAADAAASIGIDATLTQSGKAADAKKTGDEISDLKEDFTQMDSDVKAEEVRAKSEEARIEALFTAKAPGIYDESDVGYNFDNLISPESITFQGNEFAFGTAKYANAKNYMPRCGLYSGTHSSGLAFKRRWNFIVFNNKPSASGYQEIYDFSIPSNPIPAGRYKYCIVKDNGNSAITAEGLGYLYWWYGSKSNNVIVRTPASVDEREIEVEFTEPVTRIRPLIGFHANNTYDDFRVWISLYPVDAVFVDTGVSVESDGEYKYSADIKSLNTINTMQHNATINSIVDTKTYVDNHVPEDIVTDADLGYVTPEMFGAVGNNTGDDSSAINNCITYAINNNKAVKGFGRYRTASPIEIDCDNANIYFNTINYIGDDYAVKLAGRFNRFIFGNITATASGGKGIYIFDSAKNSPKETNRNVIECERITSDNHCIVLQAGTNKYLLYTVMRIKTLISNNSDCIRTIGSINELTCYDTYFQCINGWCFNGASIKLINCTMESNCNGGVYATEAQIISCRAIELMDCLMPGNPHYGQMSGILFKNKPEVKVSQNTYIQLNSPVYYESIDLSEVTPANDGSSSGSINNHSTGVVANIIRYGDLNYQYGHFNIGSKMYLHGKDKVCVPIFGSAKHITSQSYDMRDSASKHFPYLTKFIIDSDNCEIWLAPSYCAEGYDTFVVDMSTKMATVYDRRENMIFDPVGKENGIYSFVCYVDPMADDSHQMSPNNYPIYSGYNDVWEITKL